MTRDATGGPTRTERASQSDGWPWHYLVVLPAAELPVAGLAMVSSQNLGPGHSVTAMLGVFLLYATPVVGALSFAGLVVEGRRGTGTAWWYAGLALAIAAVLSYHGTEPGAFYGLWEPTVALALAMVPVGSVYLLRHRVFADREL